MSTRIFAAIVCCAAGTTAAVAEEFPYRAYVLADDVYVRSGPGENYYPTEKLPLGTEVEVYRHDPGGCYAVRPPEHSFSWVSAEFIDLKDDNIGVVTGDRVAARVGSMFNDDRDVIQVQLYRGEEVEVVGAKRFGEGPGEQTWYQIAPPAGEFRWISGRLLDRHPPSDKPRNRRPYRNRLLDPPGSADGDEDDADGDEDQGDYEDSVGARRSASLDRDFAVEPEGDEAAVDLDRVERGAEKRTARRASAVPLENFEDELTDIELHLSEMVLEEPQHWSLLELHARAERAYSVAATALERGRARSLLNRIERFEELQRRARLVAAVDEQRAEATGSPALGGERYDATGRLVRVKSSRAGAPAFALVDVNGAIQSFATAAPGVNLSLYVGRTVGIVGTTGYVPEFDKPHVTARRVTIVEGARR